MPCVICGNSSSTRGSPDTLVNEWTGWTEQASRDPPSGHHVAKKHSKSRLQFSSIHHMIDHPVLEQEL
jgi:hypothetical protein